MGISGNILGGYLGMFWEYSVEISVKILVEYLWVFLGYLGILWGYLGIF